MALATELTKLLDIRHPILLAPMGAVSGGRLAAAVTRAGGLGLLGPGYFGPDWIEQQFDAAGNTPVGIGFITWHMAKHPEQLEAALARKPRVVMLSFGDPAPYIPLIRQTGAIVIAQVQSLEMAAAAAKAGVDIIVAQGAEAGGHGASRGGMGLIPAVVDAVAPLPVVGRRRHRRRPRPGRRCGLGRGGGSHRHALLRLGGGAGHAGRQGAAGQGTGRRDAAHHDLRYGAQDRLADALHRAGAGQ